jgi:hypothetical protein
MTIPEIKLSLGDRNRELTVLAKTSSILVDWTGLEYLCAGQSYLGNESKNF